MRKVSVKFPKERFRCDENKLKFVVEAQFFVFFSSLKHGPHPDTQSIEEFKQTNSNYA